MNDFPLTGDPADMYKTFGVEIAKAAAEVERENLGALVKGPATGAVVGGQDH